MTVPFSSTVPEDLSGEKNPGKPDPLQLAKFEYIYI